MSNTSEIEVIKQQRNRLRAALAALVGADSADELRAMEGIIRIAPAPEADKIAMLNAIHALLEVESV